MKKRILASLFILCLLLSLFPTAALAAEDESTTGEAETVETGSGGTSTETGEDSSTATYDNDATVTRAILAELIYQNEYFKSVIGTNTDDADFGDIGDLNENQQTAINAMANAHFISGTGLDSDGKLLFNPSGSVTRADAAVIFWKLTGSKKVDTSSLTLTDVNATDWYAPAVAAMAAAGIITGTKDNKFNPTGIITVQQLNGLITRCAEAASTGDLASKPAGGTRLELLMEAYEKYKDSPLATVTANEIAYADIGACTPEEQEAIQFFTSRGVVSGYSPDSSTNVNLFGPYDAASNLQAAMFLYQCAVKFEPESVAASDPSEVSKTVSAQAEQETLFAQAVSYDLNIPEGAASRINAAWAYLEQEIGTDIQDFKTNPNDAVSTSAVTGLVDALVPEAPTISVSDEGQVTITTERDTVAYYTFDEIAPTVNSAQYTAAFALGETSTIKAVAVRNSLYSNVTIYTKPEAAALSITASKTSLNGGGYVTLTVSNIPEGETVSVTCSAVSIAVTGSGDSWEVTLPNTTADYTFTVTAGDETADCTVSVTRRSSGGGGSSSGGSSPSNTTTETVTNKDGSKTTTVTNKTTGTVTETTRNTDGSTLVVETRKDGTVTTTDTAANGVKVKTVDEPGEDVTVAVTIPRSVGTATVTIPADVDYGMVAVDADTGEIVKLSVPTEDGMAVKLDGSAKLVIVDNAKAFDDTRDHWAEDAIDFATAHELFAGTSAATFTPDSPMTRAMLMTVLARFDGEDTAGGSVWYEKGMAWAVANGVSDGSNPNGSITREQFATMLWRYAGSPAAGGSLTGFSDAGSVSGYATDAMRWAVSTGIISGMGNGLLAPQGNATRAQVAAILMRFTENLTK